MAFLFESELHCLEFQVHIQYTDSISHGYEIPAIKL